MGAYDNPEQLVDTQTGQHLRKLQETISGTFSNYAKTYADREAEQQAELKKQQTINAKKLADDQKEVEDYSLALRTKMADSQEGNKELNLSDTFEPMIQEAAKLKSGLLNGSIQDRQAAIAKLAKINGSVSSFTDSLSEFDSYSTKLQTITLKPTGSEGGLSEDMPAEDIKAINIMEGKRPGSKKAVYENNDPDKLVWEIYEKDNPIPVKRYYANKMKDMDYYGDGDYVRSVPDMSVSNQKLKTTVDTVFENKTEIIKGQEVKESTGRLTDAMLAVKKDLPQEINYRKEYIGGQPGVYKLVADVDKTKVMGNTDLNALLKSRIAGMTDSEIIIYNNNILNKTLKNASILNKTEALTTEQKDKFLENYKEHFWETQVKHTQDFLKEDSNVATFQDPDPIKNKLTKTKKSVNTSGSPAFDMDRKQEVSQQFKRLIEGKSDLNEIIKVPELDNSFSYAKIKGTNRYKIVDENGKTYTAAELRNLLNKRKYTPEQKRAQETGGLPDLQ